MNFNGGPLNVTPVSLILGPLISMNFISQARYCPRTEKCLFFQTYIYALFHNNMKLYLHDVPQVSKTKLTDFSKQMYFDFQSFQTTEKFHLEI